MKYPMISFGTYRLCEKEIYPALETALFIIFIYIIYNIYVKIKKIYF